MYGVQRAFAVRYNSRKLFRSVTEFAAIFNQLLLLHSYITNKHNGNHERQIHEILQLRRPQKCLYPRRVCFNPHQL